MVTLNVSANVLYIERCITFFSFTFKTLHDVLGDECQVIMLSTPLMF